MRRPAEACRASMERARRYREDARRVPQDHYGAWCAIVDARADERAETRATVARLRVERARRIADLAMERAILPRERGA